MSRSDVYGYDLGRSPDPHLARDRLVEELAEAAWLILNHDNDWRSGEPCDTANWANLKKAIDKTLPRRYALSASTEPK